jgi:ApeA N-terminal domain 1
LDPVYQLYLGTLYNPQMFLAQRFLNLAQALEGMVDEMSPERLKEVALEYIDETIHQRAAGECHPRLYRQKDGTARRGWGFKSLLGAMWLQMMWLRSTPAEEVERCPWCRKTIAFEPQPEQPEIDAGSKQNARRRYRTREDKTFCNSCCRAKWNYHFGKGKSSKHTRKSERERRKTYDS